MRKLLTILMCLFFMSGLAWAGDGNLAPAKNKGCDELVAMITSNLDLLLAVQDARLGEDLVKRELTATGSTCNGAKAVTVHNVKVKLKMHSVPLPMQFRLKKSVVVCLDYNVYTEGTKDKEGALEILGGGAILNSLSICK